LHSTAHLIKVEKQILNIHLHHFIPPNLNVRINSTLFLRCQKALGFFLTPYLNFKINLMKNLFLILILICGSVCFAQPYYYNSGDPSDVSNWGNIPGGTGTNPPNFSQPTEYIIESGKTATLISPLSISNAGGTVLRVNSGGSLVANFPLVFSGFPTFVLDSGSTYIHNNLSLPLTTVFSGIENFNRYSNFIINDWFGTGVSLISGMNTSGTGFYFGNLEINWTSNVGDWFQNFSGQFISLSGNDLRISSTGSGRIIWGTNGSASSASITVWNYIQTDGEVDMSLGSTIVSGYATVLSFAGNFTKTGGILDASAVSAFGLINFNRGPMFSPFDTTHQTFSNSGTLRKVKFTVKTNTKLRLLSNLPLTTSSSLCGMEFEFQSKLDCNSFQVSGFGPLNVGNNVRIRIDSPNGFKHGASGGNITTVGVKTFLGGDTLEFAGTASQITGDSMPASLSGALIVINNPNDVTLSKSLRVTSVVRFLNGKLNLGNYDLTISNLGVLLNFNQNRFINTNGTGSLRLLTGFSTYVLPIGCDSYAPIRIIHNGFDTLAYRVSNLIPSALPRDTSYAVKKVWHVVEQTPGGSSAYLNPMWMMTDVGSNFNPFDRGAVAKYNSSTLSYEPKTGFFTVPFLPPPFPQALTFGVYATPATLFNSFSATDYFMAGNEVAFYERYFYNSGDAGLLSSWKENEDGSGSSPSTFDSYALFNIGQNKIAEFNTPVTFGVNTQFRPRGNSQFTSNQPITVNGVIEFLDSCTYNHNNTAIAANTIWAGYETFADNSTYNIMMWSDTTHKIKDGVPEAFGNLIIDFNNLPSPIGTGAWAYHNFASSTLTKIDFWLKRCSGYQFSPLGYYYQQRALVIFGDLKIGDSTNYPFTNPILNLSLGTLKSPDSLAGTLYIDGNVDIQVGGMVSQDFPVVAKGRFAFQSNKKHTFYSYKSFLWAMYNLGNSNFPNTIYEGDTLVLKSDFYNSSQPPFLFNDMLEVKGVLDVDQYAIRTTNLRVTNGGKIITRNPNGFDIQLSNVQTANFQTGSSLEFAGNTQQQFMSDWMFSTEIKEFPNIIINNPAGVVLNIDSVVAVDTLKLLNGKLINPGTNPITILNNTEVVSQNGAFLEGPVKALVNVNFPKYFPIGKGNKSRVVSIWQFNMQEAEYTMEFFDTVQTYGDSLGTGLTGISSLEYFTIEKNSSFSFQTIVGLGWGQNAGITSIPELRVARWNGTFWEDVGNIASQGTPDSGLIFSGGITSFSPFIIATTDSQPLPIELSSFTSTVDKNNVRLNWSTANEVNNSGFDIERKLASDSVWTKLTFVSGAGNSSSLKNYSYEDRNILTGKYNYRLKQIDFNGNFVYYNLNSEINVGIPEKFDLSQNYPNPFNPETKINFELPKDSKVSLKVFDITGRLIASILDGENFNAGYHTVRFNGTNFASGTYFYRISTGDFVLTKKMQLVK